jgi:hypothetical protein
VESRDLSTGGGERSRTVRFAAFRDDKPGLCPTSFVRFVRFVVKNKSALIFRE